MKHELLSPRQRHYFELLKGTMLPTLEGTLVSSGPKERPSQFLLAMPGSDLPDVTLVLEGNLEKPLTPGTNVSFDGIVSDFKAEPFMLVVAVDTVRRSTIPAKKKQPQDPNKTSK